MNDIEQINTSCITPDMEQNRSDWHDRFKVQKTARLQTLRECMEELYGQDMQVHQGKDMIYQLRVDGVFSRRFSTIRDAGLEITGPSTHAKIILGIDARRGDTTQAPVMDKADTHTMFINGIPTPMVEVKALADSTMPGPSQTEPEPELTHVQQGIASVIKATEARIAVLMGDAEDQIKALLGSEHVQPMLGLESWSPATKENIGLSLQLRCGVEDY